MAQQGKGHAGGDGGGAAGAIAAQPSMGAGAQGAGTAACTLHEDGEIIEAARAAM